MQTLDYLVLVVYFVGMIVIGLALLSGSAIIAIKLLLIWILVLAASAASAHLIAQQALRREQD